MKPKQRMLSTSAAGLAAVLTAAGAYAFNPQPEPPAFGMVGLGRGQAAHLHAVLAVPPEPVMPRGTDSPCHVRLSFVDEQGIIVIHGDTGMELSTSVELRPGIAASLVLPETAMRGASTRALVRAVMGIVPPTAPDGSVLPYEGQCDGLTATLEISDRQGRTQLLYPLYSPFGWSWEELGATPPDDTMPR